MKILVSGCSFTAGGPNAGENWACYIKKKAYVENIGIAGAGNGYINQSTIVELISRPDFYDIVLVMWSGLQRYDVLFSRETYKTLEYGKVVNAGYHWGLVGDWVSHAHHPESTMRDIGKMHFSLTDEETLGCQSLLNMICLQNFLKAKNIPYKFMSYVNYWNDKDTITNLNFGVYKYQSCRKLAEQLDFSNFLFYNNDHDGFYEFSKERGLIGSDKFHPNLQAHQEWGAWIEEKIREQL